MQISGSNDSGHWVSGARPFLVGVDDRFGDARITVHAARAAMSRDEARRLKRQLREEGVFSRFRVKRYAGNGAQYARTLEAFLAPFSHDHIIYDATGAFQRAQRLVNFARAVRGKLEDRVAVLLWQQEAGTLFIVLDPERFPKEGKARRLELARIEALVRKAIRATCGSRAGEFVRGIKIGFHQPRAAAMPIDNRSLARRLH